MAHTVFGQKENPTVFTCCLQMEGQNRSAFRAIPGYPNLDCTIRGVISAPIYRGYYTESSVIRLAIFASQFFFSFFLSSLKCEKELTKMNLTSNHIWQ